MQASEHEQRERISALQATDGYPLRYRVWPSVSSQPRATLVLLNGIMSNSAWFSPIVPRLPDLHVVGADRRGSGPNDEMRGDAPSAGQLVDDVSRIARAEHAPGRPLVLLGWCWGAALAVAVAHELGDAVDGLVLVTPGLFPTQAVKQAVADQAEQIERAAPDAPVIASPIREEMFTHGPALDAFIRHDEHRVRVMTPRMLEVSNKLAAAAVARLGRLRVPVLLVLASDDEATDNEATRRAFARIDAARLSVIELPSRHGVQFDAAQPLSSELHDFVQRLRGVQ